MRNPVVLLCLVSAIGGCSDQFAPERGGLLRLDGEVSIVESPSGSIQVTLPFAFQNGREDSVFVERCDEVPPPFLQHRTGADWVTVWAAVATLCSAAPLRIEAGATYEGSAIASVDRAVIPGEFRLVWEVLEDFDPDARPSGTMLPELERASALFSLNRSF
jgi:hypothetical protein